MPVTFVWLLGAAGILYLVRTLIVSILSPTRHRSHHDLRDVLPRLIENPLTTAFIALLVSAVLVIGITLSLIGYKKEFFENVMVEAHGMLFDILVVGLFILWLNTVGERRLESRRYQEEISDFRGWQSEEAMYRIVGNIGRLGRNGLHHIDLSGCYLAKADLSRVNLEGANLIGANLEGAELRSARLAGAGLAGANLQGADLMYADLAGAGLLAADLRQANLMHANLRQADLAGAKLQNAQLFNANLENANLRGANLEGADLVWADLRGVKFGALGIQQPKPVPSPPRQPPGVEQLSTVKSLSGARLDPDLQEAIQEAYPQLLVSRTIKT